MRNETIKKFADLLRKHGLRDPGSTLGARARYQREAEQPKKPSVDTSLAAQIIAAGECARRGGPVPAPPPKGSLASQIIAAAATARAGGPELARPTGLAAQIVEAGRKRRGEA